MAHACFCRKDGDRGETKAVSRPERATEERETDEREINERDEKMEIETDKR